jgi:hypothetical protein
MKIKGLFIKEPWISLILEGKKTWEIRGSNTKIRGRIALIASGTGEVKGFVDIVDSISLNGQEFDQNTHKHNICLDRYNSSKMPYKKTHAWIFSNPLKLEKGIPFKMKQGCVIWINLENEEIYKKSLYK